MNLQHRITKLEATINASGAGAATCRCANAVAIAATPFFKTCFRCGAVINLDQWQHWRMFHPEAGQSFGFGLRRDDAHELDDKQQDFFIAEIIEVLAAVCPLNE